MNWEFALASEIGSREKQQDRIAVFTSHDGASSLAVLADGLGGHSDGGEAAQYLLDVAERRFQSHGSNNPEELLRSICDDCHHGLKIQENTTGELSATTCVMLLLNGDEAHWAHVGDSRLYHFRNQEMVFRTRDHALSDLSEYEMDSLGLDQDSQASRGQVFMCLGGSNSIDPELGLTAIDQDDWFMLCSDGVWSAYDEKELVRITVDSDHDIPDASRFVQKAVEKLGDQADNSSIIFARPGEIEAEQGLFSRLFAWG